ncbi:putative transcriptional regulatory protein [Wickerhamomyces ciferrii]|uniref:Transcriptional regulatory protein n=1 Tax=Wickerhamomyces ciferrii (strain ATCC 14091 / BCRC 22168 / CBS 111 / JCM 3599 / NBRC 0793 / NRRL Y-1031 F-60-10) TaxID=1206466 RepID=K0KRK3_WICCF|nr:putative transcriptional regulatory protein [Wickerhamomyces ciferrii]CCH44672.1 putative transcriptional regulatory protein [Wickerhamomyces ciferrii]
MVRTFLACDNCRRSKLRCLSNVDAKGEPNGKCQRCAKHHFECQYTPKPSQLKKQIRREKSLQGDKGFGVIEKKNSVKRQQLPSPCAIPLSINPSSNGTGVKREETPPFLSESINNYGNKHGNRCANYLDSMILPNRSIMLEIVYDFFNNQVHSIFNFLHKESYIDYIKGDKFGHQFFNYDDPEDIPIFTPCTLLAIMALCARNNETLTKMYGEFDQNNDPEGFVPNFGQRPYKITSNSPSNASKYFAFYSRQLLKDMFDTPSIQRVQSLTILSSHEWSEGNAARSYLYIGIAARMGAILGLGCNRGVCYENEIEDPRERFISMESKRRTIWSVYMMDRCNSSGRNRSHALKIEDIEVSLPCPEKNFQNGIPIDFPSYNDCFRCLGQLTSLDFTIIGYELWSKIAKWVGEIGSKKEKLNPSDPNSSFYKLSNDLQLLRDSMPKELDILNLNKHLEADNLNFGFLHQLLYLSGIFLNREYFYYSSDLSQTDHYQFTKKLINQVQESSSLIMTLVSRKKFIITPFTAFELFTNSVTCLSISNILNDLNLKSLGVQNMELLKMYFHDDHLGMTWYGIIEQLLRYLERCNHGVFNRALQQNTKLSNLLNDYGESDIPEQHTTHPYQTKKIDLNDILNSSDSESNYVKNNEQIETTPLSSINSIESQSIQHQDPQYNSSAVTSISSSENDHQQLWENSLESDIDKYFKNWDKIIPNWNDVFVEDRTIDDVNSLFPS